VKEGVQKSNKDLVKKKGAVKGRESLGYKGPSFQLQASRPIAMNNPITKHNMLQVNVVEDVAVRLT
jgi:hypothetical protein